MSTAIKANANSITATSQHSLRQLVRTQINEYSRLTQLLFTNLEILADGKTPPAPPNDIMKQIVQLDATLMGAVEKIELHQRQQRRIRQVRLEIEEQNKAIMAVIQSLRSAKQVLELNLENLEEKRAASADARSAEVSISDIVSYANRLSAYTSAPPNFNSQDPNQPFEPPYPREVNMRAGILNQQHIPAAALVTLDGGVMPGTTGPPPQGGPGVPGSLGRDEDGDDDSSASEEEFSLYGRIQDEERRRQEQGQGQMPEEEHAGDIFDLDLS
ncbi:hypothetical protein CPC16_011971 [Podila verticillata]|nr:hypothetical protein BGZ59_006580 [Podila verticillata]KAF9377119.1 hypothetical protein CPC16_011971 [Podila verticillata]KAI9236063.1 MAG: vitamin-D-receptor interacting mediator subunit 4-domain-containing protein [Podila humilis]KFH73602.1 hypothetical protein MVEG_00817 [Podila verticillata NRRL 6337]